ncbi:DNA helicase [Microbacterium sp.]|uniref:DNA helicase n=1 Tax=Microbacterium sp. TaxID=51671 RepID=UPI003F7160B9
MSLSRKRKKELKKLQSQANNLWQSQQVLVSEAADVAREASRQLGYFGREQVAPRVREGYEQYAAPYLDKGVQASKQVLQKNVIPTAGVVVGSALSAWDAANETRARLAAGRGFSLPDSRDYAKKADKYAKSVSKRLSGYVPAPQKQGMGAGGVIAIILGVAAAVGVLYAAWQTLRADDELWVADDPLRAPDA